VGARFLALLALAALMKAEEFALCVLALALSDFARCVADGGIDPVFLRRAEAQDDALRRKYIARAALLKLLHGALAALVVVALLLWVFDAASLFVWLLALQFFAQALVQLGLNAHQADNTVQRVAPRMIALYLAGLLLALSGFAGWQGSRWALPLIAAGELVLALSMLAPRLDRPAPALGEAYRSYFPLALPMAGLTCLALINTRSDAFLATSLLPPGDAGRYLYLGRWGDAVPMFAGGLAMPLVGKLAALQAQHRAGAAVQALLLFLLTALPFALVWLAMHLQPAYAVAGWLPWLIAAAAAVRTGATLATVNLLSRWHDRGLLVLAVGTAIAIPACSWLAGRSLGAVGIALVILTIESCNLGVQLVMIRQGRNLNA
jgi:hypothetical protein